jgi:hypothetical protein
MSFDNLIILLNKIDKMNNNERSKMKNMICNINTAYINLDLQIFLCNLNEYIWARGIDEDISYGPLFNSTEQLIIHHSELFKLTLDKILIAF